MSIANYTDLVAAMIRRLHRADLAADIPDFIMLAEKRISTMLRARLMETSGSIATVAGAAYATLPTTLLGIDSLSIAGVSQGLDFISPDLYQKDYGDSRYTGAPRVYTTIGDKVYFGPTPDAIYTVSIIYRSSLVALTSDAPTNALLTKWPNAYLYGALAESSEVTKNAEEGQRWEGRFRDAIDGINLVEWHAGGSMRVRSDVRM